MTEFDYEVKERKALVPSARRRKNGVKSKKCTLPHEFMTKGEQKKLNGEVVSVNMERPCDIHTLRKASKEVQIEYIQHLRKGYKASTRMLGQMLGLSQASTRNYLIKLGIELELKGAAHATKQERIIWQNFIGGEQKEAEVEPKLEQDNIEPQIQKVEAIKITNGLLIPTNGNLVYNGSVKDICSALVFTLGAETQVSVNIAFEKMEELQCSEI